MKKVLLLLIAIPFFFIQSALANERSTPILMAGGQDYNTGNPFLVVSNDGAGDVWDTKPLGKFVADGEFSSASCTKEGSSSLCVAVGKYFWAQSSRAAAVLYVSTDRGNTWANKKAIDMPEDVQLYAVSCTGHDAQAVCVAAGSVAINGKPFMLASTDRGVTWDSKTISGLDAATSEFVSISCTGEGVTAVCAAVTRAGGKIP
jgi:hypothetical protein